MLRKPKIHQANSKGSSYFTTSVNIKVNYGVSAERKVANGNCEVAGRNGKEQNSRHDSFIQCFV
jgi:hypothetical protein